MLLLPRPAAADDKTEQARIYFDAGAQAFSAGRYPVAIEAFRAAYKLAERPAILFSMAQAERKQFWIDKQPEGLAHAIDHYRQYLAAVQSGGRRDDAATALAELEPVAARIAPVTAEAQAALPTGTRILLSSRAVNARAALDGGEAAPLPRLVSLPPGAHHVSVSAEGYQDDARDVTLVPGVTTAVELNLREQPGLLTVQAEGGATVYVDGRPVLELPSAHPIEAPSGTHTVEVAKNGRQLFRQEVTLERGKEKTLIVALALTRQRRISEVVMIVGGAGLLTSGAFLLASLAEQGTADNVKSQRQTTNISAAQLAQYNSALAARNDWRSAGLATASGSLAVLATGAALFLFDHPTPETAKRDEHAPVPAFVGPAGCGCTLEVSALPVPFADTRGVAMALGVVGRF
jgi:hypothetical protein